MSWLSALKLTFPADTRDGPRRHRRLKGPINVVAVISVSVTLAACSSGGGGNGGGGSGGGGGSVVFDIHEVSRSLAKPAGGSFPIADFAPGRTRGGEAGRRGLASGVEFDEKASDRFQHQGRRRYNRHSSRNLRSRAHVLPVLAKYF